MDFLGQKLAEQLYQIVMIIFASIGFIIGFIQQDFNFTLYSFGIGMLISSLVSLPDWPYLNKHPVNWRTPTTATPAEDSKGGDPKKKIKKIRAKAM